jgi:cell division transport system ATP-binding protein
VFQDFRLLPNKTVFDNVAFSLQVIGKSRGFIQEAVPDTLKMVGLAEKAQRLPHELSGGEQQRVAIARAIVNKPQVLLADEPTGNLDPTTSAGIMALLERINAGGTTVIMATHEAGIVDQMQRRVIELASGKIVRDERQGGYATAAINTVAVGSGRRSAHEPRGVPSVAARASVFAPNAPKPSTFPSSAEPSAPAETAAPVPIEARPDVRQIAARQSAAITADTGMPLPPERSRPESDESETEAGSAVDAGRGMTRPVLPVTQHDVPDQLTLAEKLGLRAPGEKPDQTGEQNVGPTR